MPDAKPASAHDPSHPRFVTTSSPFYWLQRVSYGHVQNMERILKPIGLDVPRWRILTTLAEMDALSVSQLADHGGMKLSTMTKTVQRLDADGLVRTRTADADARVTEVLITAKGRKAVATARAQASNVFRHTFNDLSDREIAQFIAILQRIHANQHLRG